MRLLHAGSGENLNVRGAYLEVWSDLLGSIGVLIGALVMLATGWRLVDPLLAVGMGLWVLPRTTTMMRESVHVLLEGVPRGLDLAALRTATEAVPGVASVHDLHVWSLSTRYPALAAHVVLAPDAGDAQAVRERIADLLARDFGIEHTTLQVESVVCDDAPCESGQGARRHVHHHHHHY
jgi:cobalt-zinc-cadmium efflux system protein